MKRWSPLTRETVYSVQARKFARRRDYWRAKAVAEVENVDARGVYLAFAEAADYAHQKQLRLHNAFVNPPPRRVVTP